jgi:hypothetical protein
MRTRICTNCLNILDRVYSFLSLSSYIHTYISNVSFLSISLTLTQLHFPVTFYYYIHIPSFTAFPLLFLGWLAWIGTIDMD